ncbi:type II toxin-antitoxin system RelE/ParE family toxin, partial [bacterium]|nr:type II toxin-antitoxin system RelE/ParE family toxin [bacterium]
MKPFRLILTDAAKADLKGIYDYISKDSELAAASFVKDLIEKLESLSKSGVTGSSRDWVSTGLKGFPVRNISPKSESKKVVVDWEAPSKDVKLVYGEETNK